MPMHRQRTDGAIHLLPTLAPHPPRPQPPGPAARCSSSRTIGMPSACQPASIGAVLEAAKITRPSRLLTCANRLLAPGGRVLVEAELAGGWLLIRAGRQSVRKFQMSHAQE